jgi:hypothetical protein
MTLDGLSGGLTLRMGIGQGFTDLAKDGQGPGFRDQSGGPDQLGERDSRGVLHRYVVDLCFLEKGVDIHDVAVAEPGVDFGLIHKALQKDGDHPNPWR